MIEVKVGDHYLNDEGEREIHSEKRLRNIAV